MSDQLLTKADLCNILGVSKNTLARYRAKGMLPPEIVFNFQNIRWRKSDIDEWIAMGCPSEKKFMAAKKE